MVHLVHNTIRILRSIQMYVCAAIDGEKGRDSGRIMVMGR